jgi:uncharacterized membrane protein YebE (DUF533 family)
MTAIEVAADGVRYRLAGVSLDGDEQERYRAHAALCVTEPDSDPAEREALYPLTSEKAIYLARELVRTAVFAARAEGRIGGAETHTLEYLLGDVAEKFRAGLILVAAARREGRRERQGA